jgi:hypothetical protein
LPPRTHLWIVAGWFLVRLVAVVSFFALTAASLGCLELGRRVGRQRVAALGEEALEGFGAIEGAVFALLGLLLAFTFSAAAARYDARKDLIVEEANAIGTAYLRLDALPPATQPALRQLFGEYVDARLAVYASIHALKLPREELDRVSQLQHQIWDEIVAACRASPAPPQAMLLVFPPVNQMFDLTTTRTMALRTHIPALVLVLLVLLMLAGSALAGHGMAHVESRSWPHMLGFAFMLGISVYVILDYEFPRLGLIRLEWADQVFVDLRRTMP